MIISHSKVDKFKETSQIHLDYCKLHFKIQLRFTRSNSIMKTEMTF